MGVPPRGRRVRRQLRVGGIIPEAPLIKLCSPINVSFHFKAVNIQKLMIPALKQTVI